MNKYKTFPEELSKEEESSVKELSKEEEGYSKEREESQLKEFSEYYFEKVGKYPSEDLLETIRVGINRKYVK
jgi:hypothetical protein